MNAPVPSRPGSALIACAGGELAKAVAEALTEDGFDVHLAGADESALDEIRDTISSDAGPAVEVHPTDLGQSVNAAVLAMECDDAFALVNALPNCPPGGIADTDDDDWHQAFANSLMATVALSREVLEGMRARGCGVIVTIGAAAQPGDILGASLNAALAAFCDALSRESRDDGIAVHFVRPADGSEATGAADTVRRLVLAALR